MKKKAGLWLLIFICSSAFLLPGALGAPGEANLFTDTSGDEYIKSVASLENIMYFLGNEGLYYWHKDMKEPQLTSGNIRPWQGNIDESNTFEEPFKNFDGSIQVLATYENTLWGLNIYEGVLCKLEEKNKDKQEWSLQPVAALDWEDMVTREGTGDESWVQPKEISTPVIQDNILYLFALDYTSMGDGKELFAFDLDTGEQKKLKTKNIQNIAPFEKGKLWALEFDRSQAYQSSNSENEHTPVFGLIDIENGGFEPMGVTPHMEASGLAYNQKEKILYLAWGGSIYRWNEEGDFTFVNYIPFHNSWNGGEGFLFDDNQFYGIYAGNKVYVRSLNSAMAPDKALTILGAYSNLIEIEAFEKNHPEIPLKLLERQWGQSSIGEQILLGDSEADIYRIHVNYDQLKTLKEKGYTVDLSPSQVLTQAVEQMYPEIQKVLYHQDALVAVPSTFWLETAAYAPELFEKFELTPPETWRDAVALHGVWGNEIEKEYQDYFVSSDMYSSYNEEKASNMLLRQMIDGYAIQKLLKEETLSFDSLEFRELLKAFEEHKEGIDQIDIKKPLTFYSHEPHQLIELRMTIPQGDFVRLGYVVNPLPFVKGEEVLLEGQMEVYIINLHSKNKELAMIFMESLVQNMAPTLAMALYPDKIEPIPQPRGVIQAEEGRKELAKMKEELKTAEEAEKQQLEEMIGWQEEWLDRMEKEPYYWIVSPAEVENYKQLDGKWKIIEDNLLRSRSGELGALYEEANAYSQGTINADQLIQRLNQKIQMIEMENQ